MGFADDDDNLPDWLSDLNPSSAEEPGGEPAKEEAPDWLAEATPAEGGLFDALGDQDEDGDDVPDWLANIRTSEGRAPDEDPPPPTQPVSFEQEDEASADWLEPIRARESGSLPPLDEDSPDFGTRLKTLKAQDAPEEEPDASGDWLAGLNNPAEPPAASASDSGGDWMAGLSEPTDEPVAGAGFPLPEPEDKPDWLQEIGSGLGLGLTGTPAGESAPAWLMGEESSPDETGAPDLPDWAAAATSEAAEAVESEFPGLASEPGLGSDAPNWLTEFRPDAEPEPPSAFAADYDEAASEVFKLDSGELPDWLAQITPEDALPAPAEPEPVARPVVDDDTGDLAPAELPSWLQEMRPVASIDAADLQDQEAETAEAERIGPLAGLTGVLPAEPEIVQFGRPPSAASGLQLSEIQRGYSLQLAQMVAEEVRSPRRAHKANPLPQRLVQAVLALTLMAAVALPLMALLDFFSLPRTAGRSVPAEIQSALDVVNGLPPGSLVLVAVEYQPAFSGEVEAAATGLVDHLLIGGARLALISTLPSGPAQIEHFMATSQRINHPNYLPERDYYNLGYLPGGVSGLLQLATDPRVAITHRLTDGSDIWAQTAFANIFRVRDFAAVVVLADDPDAARAWVEQVQPALVDPISGRTTPLLVVSSVQAEPLLWPYVQNEPSQIQGLVAGLRGGAYYEASIRELRVRRYWDAYAAGLLVMAASLLIGGGLGLSRNLAGGLKRNKGGAR